jgi:hypothetical protein
MRGGWRVALASLAIAAATLSRGATAIAATQAAPGVVAVLLSEGRIIFVDVANGATLAEYPARTAPRGYALPSGQLARALPRDEVIAILPDETGSFVVGVQAQTFAARRIGRLPLGQYPALAIGQKSGRIFAFGVAGVTIYALAGQGGEPERLMQIELGRDVFAGTVSSDERRLYVSYHGRGTGVQWFDLTGDGWRPGGHVQTHGNFALVDGKLLAATGTPVIAQFDQDGRPLKGVDTGLGDSHLMEFAVDAPRRAIYAVGPCPRVHGGGVSVNQWPNAGDVGRLLLPVRDHSVCGERISVGPTGEWLVVDQRVEPPGNTGTLLVVDTRTGTVLQRITTSSRIIDVLAIR